jgi:23S rRNA (adenine2503-C2)-methyltransferase
MSTPNAEERVNLLGLSRPALEAFVTEMGGKAFRARQLMHWMYKRGEGRFENMTDLAKDFRAQLSERAEIRVPDIVMEQS